MDRGPQPIFTNRTQIGGHTKEYREFAPHAALKPYVVCFWTSSSFGKYLPTYVARVLPDGCVDIIFDNCDESSGTKGAVVGIMTAPGVFRYEGVIETVAVRFRPGGHFPSCACLSMSSPMARFPWIAYSVLTQGRLRSA